MEAAAAFLAVRPRSVDETRRRLRHLGYRHTLVDRVVDRLVELGYLDDESFARAWVESRDRARPRGGSVLRRELALKGVDRDLIAAVLAEREEAAMPAEPNETAPDAGSPDRSAAARLLDRRRAALEREPDPRKRRQKAYALLARNGFDPSTIGDVLGAWLEADDDAEESAILGEDGSGDRG